LDAEAAVTLEVGILYFLKPENSWRLIGELFLFTLVIELKELASKVTNLPVII
jgi:hypothetical protein